MGWHSQNLQGFFGTKQGEQDGKGTDRLCWDQYHRKAIITKHNHVAFFGVPPQGCITKAEAAAAGVAGASHLTPGDAAHQDWPLALHGVDRIHWQLRAGVIFSRQADATCMYGIQLWGSSIGGCKHVCGATTLWAQVPVSNNSLDSKSMSDACGMKQAGHAFELTAAARLRSAHTWSCKVPRARSSSQLFAMRAAHDRTLHLPLCPN